MAAIELEHVTKAFAGGVVAVDDVSLTIADGEFMVLVGPSGCGKSTLLRMIAGLEEITEGTISIGDVDVTELEPSNRDIAMVFQNYALYPHMNAGDNMGFALKMRGVPRKEIEGRVREAAAILGLTESLKKKPRTLSGGQRQRVAMGRAIVRQPQAFLMDEPLSNLDAKLRVEMRAEIARLQRDLHVTTIYVTHDQTEAMTMGDRVAVMRSGHLQQVERPQVLYERPRNLFVAEFIGSPAMNLVLGEIARSDGDVWVEFGSHRLRLVPSALESHPGLSEYERRNVVLGIRPEDIEDASVLHETHEDQQLEILCDIREDMGSEVYAHFNLPAERVTSKEVVEASVVEEVEDEATRLAAERARGVGVPFVARLDRMTQAREQQPLVVEVDVRRLHFFDPVSGLRVGAD